MPRRFDVSVPIGTRSSVGFANAGAVAGDFLYAAVQVNSTATTISPPDASWTLIEDTPVAGTANHVSIYWKTVGASEPATWTFTLSASQACQGYLRADSSMATASPIDASSEVQAPSNGATLTATGVTTTQANDLIIAAWFWTGNRTVVTSPGDLTIRHQVTGGPGLVVAEGVQATAGATGDKVVTINTPTGWGSQLIAVKPAATGAALSATVAGSSAAVASTLRVGHVLTASAAGASTAGATALAVGHALTAAVQGGSGGTANLTTQGGAAQLVADIAGGSALTASRLSLAHPLTAAITGGSAAAATRLTVGHALAGAAAGVSEATASRLTVGHALAAGIDGASEVTATLGEAQLFYGIFAGRAALAPAWFPLIDWPERTRALAVAAFDGQVAAD